MVDRRLRVLVAVIAAAVACVLVGVRPLSYAASRAPQPAASERQALYDLYASDAELARARASSVAASSRLSKARAAIDGLTTSVRIARANVQIADRHLRADLVALYRSAPLDSIDILLGAGSLGEAVDGIDLLNRSARNDARLARATRESRRAVARQSAELERARAEAESRARAGDQLVSELARAAESKRHLLAQLRARRLRVTRLDAQAHAAVQRSRAITTPPATGGAPAPRPPAGTLTSQTPAATSPAATVSTRPGSTLIVSVTAYNLTGTTASGLPTGPGICATDPRVIPLGTRFTLPGYGTCLAADTGSAVIGATVDVWLKGEEAVGFGRKTITITFLGP